MLRCALLWSVSIGSCKSRAVVSGCVVSSVVVRAGVRGEGVSRAVV